jgi:hypothetical protein
MNDNIFQDIRHIKCMKCMKCATISRHYQKLIVYLLLSALTGSALVVVFLGCYLWDHGFWAAFALMPMFLCAVPDILWNRLCMTANKDDYDYGDREKTRRWLSLGVEDGFFVLAGFLMISTFWIPITLVINDIIDPKTLGMVISGCFIVMTCYFLYLQLAYHRFKVVMYNNLNKDAFDADSSDDDPIFSMEGRDEIE